jgi:hypothetical protein
LSTRQSNWKLKGLSGSRDEDFLSLFLIPPIQDKTEIFGYCSCQFDKNKYIANVKENKILEDIEKALNFY